MGHLPQPILVALFLVGSFAIIWGLFFYFRVVTVMKRNERGHADARYQALLCQNETLKSSFPVVCQEALVRASIPLWQESTLTVWEHSTLCGGTTCFALIFGKDETVTNLLLRTTAIMAAIGFIFYMTYRLAMFVDRLLNVKPPRYNPREKEAKSIPRLLLSSGPQIEEQFESPRYEEEQRSEKKKL